MSDSEQGILKWDYTYEYVLAGRDDPYRFNNELMSLLNNAGAIGYELVAVIDRPVSTGYGTDWQTTAWLKRPYYSNE